MRAGRCGAEEACAGFQNVVQEENFGVGITSLGGSSTFYPLLAPPGYADQFATAEVLPRSQPRNATLLMLCPYGSTDGPYAVCRWSMDAASVTVLAKLGNVSVCVVARPPAAHGRWCRRTRQTTLGTLLCSLPTAHMTSCIASPTGPCPPASTMRARSTRPLA